MSDLSPPLRRVPLLTLTAAWLAAFLAGMAFVAILAWVFEALFQLSAQNSAMAIILPLAASMGIAGWWYKREGRPATGRAWTLSFLCALIAVGLNVAFVWYLASTGALNEILPREMQFSSEDLGILAGIAAFAVVLVTLVNRLGLRMGFNGYEKQQKRLAEKLRGGR